MYWLHRLLHDLEQVLTQLAQIHFVTECCAERFQRFGTVVLATVEPSIDDLLDATTQGLEQRSNDEGRDHDSDSVILLEQPLKQGLQSKNEAEVEQGQQSAQGAV